MTMIRPTGTPYNANFRPTRVPYGNLVPGVDDGGDSVRPHSDAAMAAWLPLHESATNALSGFSTWQENPSGDLLVLAPGKAVAFTREILAGEGAVDQGRSVGRLVPAGTRIAWRDAANGDNILQYGALDVAQRTQDLTTGDYVVAPVTYTKTQVTAALKRRGLLLPSETLEDFISYPVGVVQGAQHQWAGGDGLQPTGYKFTNYKRQHKSSLLCDWVLTVPLAPSPTAVSRDVPAITAVVTSVNELETPASAGDLAWATGADGELASVLALSGAAGRKYSALNHQNYVVAVLGSPRISVDPHLPLVITRAGVDITSTVLKRRVGEVNDLDEVGKYYVDRELGLVFIYEAGGKSLPTGLLANDVITFRSLTAAATEANFLTTCTGDIRPGDFVVVDQFSNFRKFVPRTFTVTTENIGGDDYGLLSVSDGDDDRDIIGQVLTLSRYPRPEIAMVKTQYDELSSMPTNGANGMLDRMPGSATHGYPHQSTYSDAGEFIVKINILR